MLQIWQLFWKSSLWLKYLFMILLHWVRSLIFWWQMQHDQPIVIWNQKLPLARWWFCTILSPDCLTSTKLGPCPPCETSTSQSSAHSACQPPPNPAELRPRPPSSTTPPQLTIYAKLILRLPSLAITCNNNPLNLVSKPFHKTRYNSPKVLFQTLNQSYVIFKVCWIFN